MINPMSELNKDIKVNKHINICFSCYGPSLDDTVKVSDSDLTGNTFLAKFESFVFPNAGTSNVVLTCYLVVCKDDDHTGKCKNLVSLHILSHFVC